MEIIKSPILPFWIFYQVYLYKEVYTRSEFGTHTLIVNPNNFLLYLVAWCDK